MFDITATTADNNDKSPSGTAWPLDCVTKQRNEQ